MSTTEILNELAKMTPAERREIAKRLAEMEGGTIDLRIHGIDGAEAAELRRHLERFAEEWDSPEMIAYDHYDAARSHL
jgi:DNA-binding GntR family transcriptional regulator